jgi:hypothetical protein
VHAAKSSEPTAQGLSTHVTLVNQNAVEMSWSHPVPDGGSAISSYTVQCTAPGIREANTSSYGSSTTLIPFDATATAMKSAVESMVGAGTVDVSVSTADRNGGRSADRRTSRWTISFTSATGDISPFTAVNGRHQCDYVLHYDPWAEPTFINLWENVHVQSINWYEKKNRKIEFFKIQIGAPGRLQVGSWIRCRTLSHSSVKKFFLQNGFRVGLNPIQDASTARLHGVRLGGCSWSGSNCDVCSSEYLRCGGDSDCGYVRTDLYDSESSQRRKDSHYRNGLDLYGRYHHYVLGY